MTRDELKTRCEVLAPLGDAQAIVTLAILGELAAAATAKPDKPDRVWASDHAVYILNRIRDTLTLAEQLGLTRREVDPPAVDPLVEALARQLDRCRHGREPIARDARMVTFLSRLIESYAQRGAEIELMRNGTLPPEDATFGTADQRDYWMNRGAVVGEPPHDPEAQAVAATRAANGLPAESAAAVTEANTALPAGRHAQGTGA